MSALAVIAGISSHLGLEALFSRSKSINGEDFIVFLEKLKKVNKNYKIAVFLDNARIHYYKKQKNTVREKK